MKRKQPKKLRTPRTALDVVTSALVRAIEDRDKKLIEFKTKLKKEVLSMLPNYANGERYNGAKYMNDRVIELIDSL